MNDATTTGQEPASPAATARRPPAKLRCVHRWIEAQAARAPEVVALTFAGQSNNVSLANTGGAGSRCK